MSVTLPILNNHQKISEHCVKTCGGICCERIYHQCTRLVRFTHDDITQCIDSTIHEAQEVNQTAFGEILSYEGCVLPNANDIDIHGNSMYIRLTVAFTCNKFDTERRMCGDYENRPMICRTAKCTEIANSPTFSVHAIRAMHERVAASSIVGRDSALQTLENLYATLDEK